MRTRRMFALAVLLLASLLAAKVAKAFASNLPCPYDGETAWAAFQTSVDCPDDSRPGAWCVQVTYNHVHYNPETQRIEHHTFKVLQSN
ncbi:MAG TPA: hypothetical protein VEJ45_11670 [Candidatus Acidoferrales bacterium]|nr:hypothetical protein [Candidatus Acidoferrales bacterium]